jgi:hypothetical protein
MGSFRSAELKSGEKRSPQARSALADRIPHALAATEPPVATVTLTVSLDEAVTDAFGEGLHRVFGGT